jgi:hypothetical protein
MKPSPRGEGFMLLRPQCGFKLSVML